MYKILQNVQVQAKRLVKTSLKKSNLFYFHDEIDKIFFRMELIMHDKGAADNFPLRLFIADHDKVTFMGNKGNSVTI